jgi:hypothetical protein
MPAGAPQCVRAHVAFSARVLTGIFTKGFVMGRAILLWLLGVPIPIILLLVMCTHH